MSTIETAVHYSKRIEGILEHRLGARGRGLHEKLSSVETKLSQDIVRSLRWIATIRNNAVHKENFEINDIEYFKKTCEQLIQRLESLQSSAHTSHRTAPNYDTIADELLQQHRSYNTLSYSPRFVYIVVFSFFVVFGALNFYSNLQSSSSEDTIPSSISDKHADNIAITNTDSSAPVSQRTFEQGALITLAKQSTSEFNDAQKEIENTIWQHIKKNTVISLGSPQVHDHGNGTYDLIVPVEWDIKPGPILATINKYFWDSSKQNFKNNKVDFTNHMGKMTSGIKIKKFDNMDELQKKPYSYDLYKLLISQPIKIVVSAEGHSGEITIATGRSCFVTCNGVGDDQYQIHFSNKSDINNLIFSSYQGEQNPVIISNVPASTLQNLRSLNATVHIGNI